MKIPQELIDIKNKQEDEGVTHADVIAKRVFKDKPKPSFKPAVHASLPYVDKAYKALLAQLAVKNKRTQKSELELSISERAEREGVK